MNKELEQEILEEVNRQDLKDFASYLGLDDEDLKNIYYEIEMDDYSK